MAADRLRERGLDGAGVGNFRGVVPATTVYYPPGAEAGAQTAAEDLPTAPRIRPRFGNLSTPADGRGDRRLPGLTAAGRTRPPAVHAGRTRRAAALLADPGRALLGLDFDGTLAPIVPDPDAARAHPDVPAGAAPAGPRLGRVAVVTGRPAAARRRLRRPRRRRPAWSCSATTGWSAGRRGTRHRAPTTSGVDGARERMPGLLRELRRTRGRLRRGQGAAVAVHIRRAADPQAAARPGAWPAADAGRASWAWRSSPAGWCSSCGRPVATRATRCAALVAEAAAPSVVVFIGDDLGDLAAFDAVDAAARRGHAGAAGLQRVDRGDRGRRPRRPRRRRAGWGRRAARRAGRRVGLQTAGGCLAPGRPPPRARASRLAK